MSFLDRARDAHEALEDAAALRFNGGSMVTRFDYSDLSPRDAYVADQMHREFARRDFVDRLEEHARLNPHDRVEAEHLAAFDAHRKAQHEARWDERERGRPGGGRDRGAER